MKWANSAWVAVGVLAALAPGCSGSVKSSDADGAGDTANGTAIAGAPDGGGTLAVGGVSGGGAGSVASAARTGIGGSRTVVGQGGVTGGPVIIIEEPGGAPPIADAGAGGVANDGCDDDEGNGCIIEYGNSITALAVDGATASWVEHGTFDTLGNYENNGRLLERNVNSGNTKIIATGLLGPVGIGRTSTHYFVYLDQAWNPNGASALARIPLAGGSAEIIERGAMPVNARGTACPNCFVHSGSTAYFPLADGIYELKADATIPVQMTDMKAYSLTVVGQYLYFEGGNADVDQIWRLALSGGTPQRIATQYASPIQADGDHLDAVQPGDPSYFASLPLSGGMWEHRAQMPSGATNQIDVDSDNAAYFFDLERDGAPYQIYKGLVDAPSSGTPVLTVPRKANVKAWAAGAGGLYWTDGHSLRLKRQLPE